MWQIRNAKRGWWPLAALLLLATALVYIPSISGGFIWDDDTLVTKNPAVKTADGLYSIWFTSSTGDYLPLTLSSFWLEWHLWKDNPAGYHIVNILLHAANAVLLWRVLANLRARGAWLAALFFAVHPVCAASVTWIAERKNTLSMLFYLASLLFFLRDDEFVNATQTDRDNTAVVRRSPDYWHSIGAFALALMAKSAAVVLPAVVLLCVWWRRGEIRKHDLWRTVPFLLLAAFFSGVAIYIQHKAIHTGLGGPHDPLWSRLGCGSWALWFYLGKIVLPVNLTMIYTRWQIDPSLAISYGPAFVFASILALFFWKRNGWGRPFLFAFCYFVIALSPVLGLFNMAFFANSQVADHFQYFAMPGILALVAAGLVQLSQPLVQREITNPKPGGRLPTLPRYAVVMVAAVLAITLTVLTWQREGLLGYSEKLWADNATKNQTSWRVYMNLNVALLENGKTNEAIQMNNKALELLGRKGK